MENLGIQAYEKYCMFDKQQQEAHNNKKPFCSDRLFHNKELEVAICPMGQQMANIGTINKKTKAGFIQTYSRYLVKNRSTCPLNSSCHKSAGNRIVEINHDLIGYRDSAFNLLNSLEGIKKRKKRCYDVEPVFANIKQNQRFRRFMLKGREKVEIEWVLLAIAQNLRKKKSKKELFNLFSK